MKFEINGVGFTNKGAELMLFSIVEAISTKLPGSVFIVPPAFGKEFPSTFYSSGLKTKIDFYKWKVDWSFLSNLVPKQIQYMYNCIPEKEIDVLLDSSGFKISDQMDIIPIRILYRKVRRYKKRGKKVILLPQAFGPLSGRTRTIAVKIFSISDLIIARDKQSYSFLQNLPIQKEKIQIYPDFTNVYIKPGSYPETPVGYIGIIPNYKIVQKHGEKAKAEYVRFLKSCVEIGNEYEKKVFFLLHETECDDKLIAELKSHTDNFLVIRIDDAGIIKNVLKNASLVVSSRFHGLISCLSQGIPVIAAGWSHKYSELLEEYGVGESLIPFNSDKGAIREKFEVLLCEDSRRQILEKIECNRKVILQKTAEMWKNVIQEIQGENSSSN